MPKMFLTIRKFTSNTTPMMLYRTIHQHTSYMYMYATCWNYADYCNVLTMQPCSNKVMIPNVHMMNEYHSGIEYLLF